MFLQKFQRCFLGEEFLDTDCLLKLDYGNLVLRRQTHLFLGYGVMTSTVILLLFWLVIMSRDFIASGQGLSGQTVPGNTYEVVTAMIQLAPPPASSESTAAHAVTTHSVPSRAGKIVKVRQDELPHAESAPTQNELKEVIRNQGARSSQGSGIGSGKGGESSGLEGFGDDGAIFGACEIMPAFLEQKKPVYPEAARIEGISGKLFVKVLIGANGFPVKAIIMKRIPEDCNAFDAVVLKSVLESTYSPAFQNGRAVKVWCMIPVSFKIDES
jgi:periplasmic protein TonB